jgi:hypothetical protein
VRPVKIRNLVFAMVCTDPVPSLDVDPFPMNAGFPHVGIPE